MSRKKKWLGLWRQSACSRSTKKMQISWAVRRWTRRSSCPWFDMSEESFWHGATTRNGWRGLMKRRGAKKESFCPGREQKKIQKKAIRAINLGTMPCRWETHKLCPSFGCWSVATRIALFYEAGLDLIVFTLSVGDPGMYLMAVDEYAGSEFIIKFIHIRIRVSSSSKPFQR